jgi:hypothetical protein
MTQTFLIISIFSVVALWFWAITDIARSRFKKPMMNSVWFFSVLFFPLLGSILYLCLKHKFTTKERRKFQPNFNRIKQANL